MGRPSLHEHAIDSYLFAGEFLKGPGVATRTTTATVNASRRNIQSSLWLERSRHTRRNVRRQVEVAREVHLDAVALANRDRGQPVQEPIHHLDRGLRGGVPDAAGNDDRPVTVATAKACAAEILRQPADQANRGSGPERREVVLIDAVSQKKILPKLGEPVRYAAPLDASLPVLIESVKAQGFEGLVAKRLDSRYEAGLRSGAWQKMRVNRGQEFVIGGYTVGTKTFDALVFGYYEGDRLIYAARTRNGFTPVVREQLFKKFRGLEIKDCPFVNLPEAKSGRWGAGLTAAKMKDCRWVKPVLVAQIEFLEWTGRKPSTAHQVRCTARRQTSTRRSPRVAQPTHSTCSRRRSRRR